MLKLLKIKNIALIQEAELEFASGLNLLTGETGAGKSILVDALGLLLGVRAHSDLVRTGESQAVSEGVFALASSAVLETHGLPVYGEEVVIRREVSAGGRGRATVNGALVPVGLLRELAPHLATIHGQHDQHGLLDPLTHQGLLDRHAGVEAEVEALRERYRELRLVERELDALRRDRREQERRREALEYQAQEIEAAGLSTGEEEELRTRKALQAHAAQLETLAAEAYDLLFEDDAAVLGRLGQVFRRVAQLAALDPAFAPVLEAKAGLLGPLEDLSIQLRGYGADLDASPTQIDAVEARLALIERLKRKYGDGIPQILAFASRCREELGGAATLEEREQQIAGRCLELAQHYAVAATALSAKRRAAARQLESSVEAELATLAMASARFEVLLTTIADPDPAHTENWKGAGLETAEFLLSANPGEAVRPLARVASGGELSRILLALKCVASVDSDELTLVFDEVDSGIGASVADAVGRQLKQLSRRQQVLCVTHLPQIASLADQHYCVAKRVTGSRTLTEVAVLEGEQRVDEVARMLGGETITNTAREHAREMVRSGQ
jgi:DNA repair protein RecN (Recombination protein N)